MPYRPYAGAVWLSIVLLTFGLAPRARAQHTDHPPPRDTTRTAAPARRPATAPARRPSTRPAARPSSDKTDPATRPRRPAPARTAPMAHDSMRHRMHSDSLHRAMMGDTAHMRMMMRDT